MSKTEVKRGRGRPRSVTNPGERPSEGHPLVAFRADREFHAWIKAQGGAARVKSLVEAEAQRLGSVKRGATPPERTDRVLKLCDIDLVDA